MHSQVPVGDPRHSCHRGQHTRTPNAVCVLVALKPLDLAKSRLSPIPPPERRRLAGAFLNDTISAWTQVVGKVFVVGPIEDLRLEGLTSNQQVELVRDPGTGLNNALLAAARTAIAAGYSSVVASVADLPALTAEVARDVMAAAAPHRRAFLADHSGGGTTMLFGPADALDPRFENGSAARHRESGAVDLVANRHEPGPSWAGARHDVDEPDDLQTVQRLGVGRRTDAVLGSITHERFTTQTSDARMQSDTQKQRGTG